MGRGKVELKRRNGLHKKAYELSILCDAEIALVIFSNRGKLYEFCSSPSMLKTLERYQKCNYGALETSIPTRETQSSYQEYFKLKGRVEVLQRSQRNLLGEDLGPLSSKDLEQLEHQLELSLKQIRSTKTQCLLDQLSDLRRKEHMLQDSNRALKSKLEDAGPANTLQLYWETGGQNTHFGHQPSQTEGFFHRLDGDSTMQIGYNPVSTDQIIAATPAHNANGYIPGWLV